ncbi:MAG: GGDEF domain-containing protein [Cyanobacteria bacterium P01_E01_bin.48]
MTGLHYLEPDSLLINSILPPVIGIINLILLIYLYRNPDSLTKVIAIASATIIGITFIPTWYFTLQAALSPDVELIETLPPLSSIPLVVIVNMFIFARPNQALMLGIVSWILIALPILSYLFLHPGELFSPRGLDLVVTLGPVMAAISVLVPAYRGLEKRFSVLQSEREHMRQISERDPLTQLYNRRATEMMFANFAAQKDMNAGAILFDIDRFKQINDRYGHNVGDIVLCQVSERCKSMLRKDDLMARWGGEEFLVLVKGVGDRALYGIAENLRLAISNEPIDPVGKVTASFGVTRLTSTDSMNSLIQRVDAAMYMAKREGRDRVISQ